MTQGQQLLILDDEPNILLTLSRALELEGYIVHRAKSIAEANVCLGRLQPDLALFDVKLPDGDGLELLETLRKSKKNLFPVIMMSGHGTIDDAVRAIHLGAADFLEKPIGQDRLLLTIANALELARLQVENQTLRDEARLARGEGTILGRSKVMLALKEQIGRVAQSEGRVLIAGENGTGKELIAQAIHEASRRVHKPFVSLNCAAVPSELIESELFGHEKGAFTGAVTKKVGKFERAHQGTLFLDEVGDMPSSMQSKLLRVLETGILERVGGNTSIKVDVRVLAATNKDLQEEIAEGNFREDLYYRLNVVPLVSPPLRARKEDLPLLIDSFLKEAAARNHRKVPQLTGKAVALLASHDFPGNVRELRNLVERIIILAPPELSELDETVIGPFVPSRRQKTVAAYRPGVRLADLVQDAERSIVSEALQAHNNVVADTARALGVERSNFHKKLKNLGLRK